MIRPLETSAKLRPTIPISQTKPKDCYEPARFASTSHSQIRQIIQSHSLELASDETRLRDLYATAQISPFRVCGIAHLDAEVGDARCQKLSCSSCRSR